MENNFCLENVNKFEYCHLQRTELSNYENIIKRIHIRTKIMFDGNPNIYGQLDSSHISCAPLVQKE